MVRVQSVPSCNHAHVKQMEEFNTFSFLVTVDFYKVFNHLLGVDFQLFWRVVTKNSNYIYLLVSQEIILI